MYLNLDDRAADVVMAALQERPHKEVHILIQGIILQANNKEFQERHQKCEEAAAAEKPKSEDAPKAD